MKKTLALILCVLTVFSLCACGAKSAATPQEAPSAAAYDSAASNSYGGFAVTEESAYAPNTPAEAPAPEPGSGSETGESTATAADIDREKIIYSADVRMETTTFDDTVAQIKAMIEGCGGFIESSSVNGNNYYNKARGYYSNRSAYLTVRVPSAKFNSIMDTLPTLGNVPYSNIYSDNITSQYYDLEARLNATKVQETRMLELLEKAETVSEVITIENKLTDLRASIERMQSTMNNYDRSVNYSTISISVEEVKEYTPEDAVPLTYWQELGQSLTRGLRNAGNFIKDFLVWFVGALPALIVLGVLGFFGVRGYKKRREKKLAKKQAEQ